MSDRRLELDESRAWIAERERADRVSRGSRAGTATVAGQVASGLVLAETSIQYEVTFSIGEDGSVTENMVLGYGLGGYGTSLGYS